MDQRVAVWVERGAAAWPTRLGDLQPPPVGVWVRGRVPMVPSLAIVGARAASQRATQLAAELATEAVRLGYAVVSGGAFGVDAAAHRAALATGGQTVAVLGTGIDVAYPERHGDLYEQIAQTGALVSVLPPGSPPRPGHFPARNPLIAALADAVVVVEASVKSGSLSTAAAADRLGRTRLAVPGSPGTAALFARGWTPLRSAGDLAACLQNQPTELTTPASKAAEQLLLVLETAPGTLAELVERTSLTVGECAELLFELESCGKACRIQTGRFLALQPGASRQ